MVLSLSIIIGILIVIIVISQNKSKSTDASLNKVENSEKEESDYVVKDYRNIKVAIMDFKKEKGSMPNGIKDIIPYLKESIEEGLYSLSMDKKHLIVSGMDLTRANSIMNEVGTDSYYEGNILYLGFIKLKKSDINPVAVITMRPDNNISTTTYIKWDYKDSTAEDKIIADYQWENKSEFYDNSGEQEVRLRIQDKYGTWSKWAEKTFEVNEEIGIKKIEASKNFFFKLFKNGNIKTAFKKGEQEKYNEYEERNILGKNHISSVAGGLSHIICAQYTGSVYTLGKNKYGQLGTNNTVDSSELVKVENVYDAKKVFAGEYASFATTHSDKVFAWGRNEEGQLGDGTQITRLVPIEIKGLQAIAKISASSNHVCAITYSGILYMWGNNKYGQLGDGTRGNKKTPISLDLKNVKDIAAGKDFTLALIENGKLFSWGRNHISQLGKGNSLDEAFPTEVRNIGDVTSICVDKNYSTALTKNGKVYYWGAGNDDNTLSRTPKEIEGLTLIQMIAINPSDVFAINYDGAVYYWKKGQEKSIQKL